MSDDIKPLGGFYQQRVIDSMCAADEAQAPVLRSRATAEDGRIATLEQRLKESEAREADKACSISALEERLKSCEFRRREQRDNFRKLLSERNTLLKRLERYVSALDRISAILELEAAAYPDGEESKLRRIATEALKATK